MNRDDTARLLAVASGFDNRKPDPDVVTAWSVALVDFDFAACRDAVVKHYQKTRDWIMPFDIISEVKRTRAKRIAEDAALTPPPGLDPDRTGDYAQWLAEDRRRSAAGELEVPELEQANDADAFARIQTKVAELKAAVTEAKQANAAAEAEARAAREATNHQRAQARDADRRAREVFTQGAPA